MRRTGALVCVLLTACGGDDDPAASCDFDGEVGLEAHAGSLQSDGSVTIYGAVRFWPPVGTPARDRTPERTVYAVYVADQEVQPTADAFNFRTWSATLTVDRMAAFSTSTDSGARLASLPVRAYLYGGCVLDLAEEDQPTVEFPADAVPGADAAPPVE